MQMRLLLFGLIQALTRLALRVQENRMCFWSAACSCTLTNMYEWFFGFMHIDPSSDPMILRSSSILCSSLVVVTLHSVLHHFLCHSDVILCRSFPFRLFDPTPKSGVFCLAAWRPNLPSFGASIGRIRKSD